MSGLYLRGAFVEFMPTFLGSIPNIITFQFNPETVVHTWKPAKAPDLDEKGKPTTDNPLAVKGNPLESFSFTLALDANDQIADGSVVAQGIAIASGVYTRLAALEMLQYPVPAAGAAPKQVGSVTAAAGAAGGAVGGAGAGAAAGAAGGVKRPVPEMRVPVVLFAWGPGRIVPVRVTNLRITETIFDRLLNPSHAEAAVDLDVLTPEEIDRLTGPLRKIVSAASKYTQRLREAAAIANLANTAEPLIGLLPF
jgi:hypothetical protein